MKKLVSIIIMAVLFLGFINSPIQAQSTPGQSKQQIELTEKQVIEVKKLYQKLFETKKELINKYIEYGVLSKEEGDLILTKMEEHFKKMNVKGYIPNWGRHHHNH